MAEYVPVSAKPKIVKVTRVQNKRMSIEIIVRGDEIVALKKKTESYQHPEDCSKVV